MNNPDIRQKAPYPVEVEAGKTYWWCACGKKQEPALLRRLAQGRAVHAGRIQGNQIRKGVVLRLQALGNQAAVRRHAREALSNRRRHLRVTHSCG